MMLTLGEMGVILFCRILKSKHPAQMLDCGFSSLLGALDAAMGGHSGIGMRQEPCRQLGRSSHLLLSSLAPRLLEFILSHLAVN